MSTRHTRMKIIEDRLSMCESRLAVAEKIIEVWFNTIPDDERQALITEAQDDDRTDQ